MATSFFAAEPIYLTLSDKEGTLLYREVIWNIMRMILMSEGNGEWDCMDAESALETLNDMPIEQFEKLKAEAEIEYASPRFQEFMERKHLYPGTASAPELQPVEEIVRDDDDEILTAAEVNERLMESLDEFSWEMFCLTYLNGSGEMD